MRVKPRTGKGGPRSTEIEETQVTVRMAPTDGGSPAKVAIKVAPSAWLRYGPRPSHLTEAWH